MIIPAYSSFGVVFYFRSHRQYRVKNLHSLIIKFPQTRSKMTLIVDLLIMYAENLLMVVHMVPKEGKKSGAGTTGEWSSLTTYLSLKKKC